MIWVIEPYWILSIMINKMGCAGILEWVAFPFSRGSCQPRDWTQVSCTAGGFFTSWGTREAPKHSVQFSHSVVSDSLWPPGLTDYPVHGILQARILEWVAFPFSRGSSQPRDGTQVSCTAGGFFTSWATREALNVEEGKGYRGLEIEVGLLKWSLFCRFAIGPT